MTSGVGEGLGSGGSVGWGVGAAGTVASGVLSVTGGAESAPASVPAPQPENTVAAEPAMLMSTRTSSAVLTAAPPRGLFLSFMSRQASGISPALPLAT